MTLPRQPRRGLSVASVMLAVAIVPTIVMLIVISVFLYISRSNEIRKDLEERGALTTAALAEISTYGVVSGNVEELRVTMRGLLASDESIVRAEVLDAQRRQLAEVASPSTRAAAPLSFERPIRAQNMAVDVFANPSSPHFSLPEAQGPSGGEGRILGYARVFVSLEPVVEAKWRYLRVTVLVLFMAAAFGLIFALALIHRLRAPLSRILQALRQIRRGAYEVSMGPATSGEMGELQETILEVAQSLRATTSGLEATVAQRTAELRDAIESANRSNEEKRDLIAGSNRRLEEERRRIALEIHDSMNSALIVVRLKAQHIEQLAGEGSPSQTTADIRRSAKDIAGSVELLYASARDIVKQLRPEVIDMLGLREALVELVRSYDEVHPACRFALIAPPTLPNLHGDLAITAYRLVQESLSNVVKHSKATAVRVQVEVHPSPSTITVSIVDNGVGFDVAAPTAGSLGLIGMRERVLSIGGSMNLESVIGSGTSVTFVLPT